MERSLMGATLMSVLTASLSLPCKEVRMWRLSDLYHGSTAVAGQEEYYRDPAREFGKKYAGRRIEI